MATLRQAIEWMLEGKKVRNSGECCEYCHFNDVDGFIDENGHIAYIDCIDGWSIHAESQLEEKEAEIARLKADLAKYQNAP